MAEYTFRCAACGETVLVDEGVRRLLVEQGCAVCGATTGGDAFEPADR